MAQLQPYCAIEGNDDGLPVVFVHGMGVDHRSLMMLDKAFDGNDSIRRIYLVTPLAMALHLKITCWRRRKVVCHAVPQSSRAR